MLLLPGHGRPAASPGSFLRCRCYIQVMEYINCAYCGTATPKQRITKKFCSTRCAQRSARGWPKERQCRHCSTTFLVRERGDANRQHCSKQCAKAANTKRISTWHAEHPGSMQKYNANRLAKNPGAWRDKARAERMESIRLLGGGCVACGVTNPNWLHVDYIPTTRNEKFRHPRHLRWIRENLAQLRLLCANHHYELTMTGRIDGTEIAQ